MNTRIRIWAAVAGTLWAFAAHAGAADRVELKDGDRTVAVTEDAAAGSSVLRAAVTGGAHEGKWDYKDLLLDRETEPVGAPAVEILKTARGSYLLARRDCRVHLHQRRFQDRSGLQGIGVEHSFGEEG